MKNLWPLVLLAGAFFMWNKSCSLPTQLTSAPSAGTHVAGSMSGGPVRQWEHAPDEVTKMGQALPPPAGVSAGTMVNTVRQGLQRSE